MSQDTATIIPFPGIPAHQVTSPPAASGRQKRLAQLQDNASRNTASLSQAIPRSLAMCGSTPGALPDPAIVAKVVIGFARRKGIAMTSIPKMFRQQLLTLCAAGDPTALMLRDWLERNRKFLNDASEPPLVGATGKQEGV